MPPSESADGLASAAATFRTCGLAVVRDYFTPHVRALTASADALTARARAADEAAAGGADLGPGWAASHRGCILETGGAGSDGAIACARSDARLAEALARLGRAVLAGDGARRVGGGRGGGAHPAARAHAIRLLNEQFIVKPPACPASGFAWHTDGQYLVGGQPGGAGGGRTTATTTTASSSGGRPLLFYASVWVPLDAVGPANGTLEVSWEAAVGAGLVGESGEADERGDGGPATTTTTPSTTTATARPRKTYAIVAAPGDAVIMACSLPHGSGPNLGREWRRVWMPQVFVGSGDGGGGAAL